MAFYVFVFVVNARQQEISVVQQRSLWYKIIIGDEGLRNHEGLAQRLAVSYTKH